MFYTICDFLTSSGYRQASCWDFVRADSDDVPYETCTRDENIGVGLSAYSKIGGSFYVNTFFLRHYIDAVESGLPVATGMTMPPNRVMRRWLMMELFRVKVKKSDFEKRFGVPVNEAMGNFLRMMKMFNIIREYPDHLQVTRSGMYWVSLMTKASMLTFPGAYYDKCLHNPWPGEFRI
jgi:coproporphyrinogen III oxidase-like Fe-S oxidoreductase